MGENNEFETFDWAEEKVYEPKQEEQVEEPVACEIGCDSCGS